MAISGTNVATVGPVQRIATRPVDIGAAGPNGETSGNALVVAGEVAVTGGLTDAELRATPVPVSGPQTDAQFIAALKSATATHSSVASSASSVTILASNAARKGARIFNSDANALYLDLSGGTAVAASRAQVKLATDEGYDVPSGYTGLITGIWAADGSGAASVVEFTA